MWQVRDFDLFAAYGAVRARTQPAMHVVHARSVMTLEEAIERVARMIGMALDWTFLESFLPDTEDPQLRRSALASSFLAALELARRGRLDIAQDEPFSPIRLKARVMDELTRAIEATLFASAEPLTSRKSPSMSARAKSRSRSASSRAL